MSSINILSITIGFIMILGIINVILLIMFKDKEAVKSNIINFCKGLLGIIIFGSIIYFIINFKL